MANYFDHCMNKEQLEQEHKRLVIKLHPDRNPNNPNATAEFQEMQAQYEERKSELNGDYTKSRKGRERREREERERKERERREQEARKKEMAIEQARRNKQKSHLEWQQGEYVYARKVDMTWTDMTGKDLLRVVLKTGVRDECVVLIETIVNCLSDDILNMSLSGMMPDGVWGGRETLQDVNPADGIYKKQVVSKVVMFRSEHYCVFGNPNGDQFISDYYMPVGYEVMFSSQLDCIKAKIAYEKQEKERMEAEKQARLLAEQMPMIEEWEPKLIRLSQGLSGKEQKEVAKANFKTMLKTKFPGTKFNVREDRYGDVIVKWEDGPALKDVCSVMDYFDKWKRGDNKNTPWMEHYGWLDFSDGELERRMSTLTKARILQQLGQVTEAFRNGGIDDEVTVGDFDWMMLHLLVGIDINAAEHQPECPSTLHEDGHRTVTVHAIVSYVFRHSDYCKRPKAKGKKSKCEK